MAQKSWFYSQKKSYGYSERKEENRYLYKEIIESKPYNSLVYIDESGIDDNEDYSYAWGQKGKRVYALKPCTRKKRLSIISAYNERALKAPFVFEGCCDRDIFQEYIATILLPELKPGQTVIMDNASFHKGGKIKQLIESAGCHLLYLPTYSPDLNPIEHQWASLKHRIRKKLPTYKRNLYIAAKAVFKELLSFR